MSVSVLFDAPGPRGRVIQRVIGVVFVLAVLAVLALVLIQFNAKGELDPGKWRKLLWTDTWSNYLVPGLLATLKAALFSILLALALGLALGIGRLSLIAPIRWVCTIIVEFFRAVPVLMMMIFFFNVYLYNNLFGTQQSLVAVITALMLYNGSIIAELVRSGVENLPKGQREAGMSIGLSDGQTRDLILLPQALTAMLPALVSQLVVVLKDTALGYVILYPELLTAVKRIGSWQAINIQAIIFGGVLFIAINYSLTVLAHLVEGRMRRGGRTTAVVGTAITPPDADMAETAEDARMNAGGA